MFMSGIKVWKSTYYVSEKHYYIVMVSTDCSTTIITRIDIIFFVLYNLIRIWERASTIKVLRLE